MNMFKGSVKVKIIAAVFIAMEALLVLLGIVFLAKSRFYPALGCLLWGGDYLLLVFYESFFAPSSSAFFYHGRAQVENRKFGYGYRVRASYPGVYCSHGGGAGV